MQFIGIGIPELLLVLILAVIVVGPERLPEVAAQLARWIRQAQAYANYVRKDFDNVIGDLEKELGTSREDLKTIGEALRRDTTSVVEEINKAGKELQEATDVEKAAGASTIAIGGGTAGGQSSNGAVDSTAVKEAAMAAEALSEEPPRDASANGNAATAEPAKEDEWFVPSPSRRRRRSGDEA